MTTKLLSTFSSKYKAQSNQVHRHVAMPAKKDSPQWKPREDKGDKEGITHTHPIPSVIRLELFLESG